MIEPVDPFQCCELDGLEGTPGSPPVDHFGLVDPEGHITSFQLYQNLAANMLLVPGSYTATATAEQLDPSFRINAGETRDIMLGN